MNNIPVSYLKDKDNNYFSPVVSEESVFISSGNGDPISKKYISALSVSGRTITYTRGDNTTGTITTQDTTYSVATTSANGLMSSADKTKLNKAVVSENSSVTNVVSLTESEFNTLKNNNQLVNGTLYNITDDTDSNSEFQYSLSEQATNKKWIDGKRIYIKTLQFTTPDSINSFADVGVLSDATKIINISGSVTPNAAEDYPTAIGFEVGFYFEVPNHMLKCCVRNNTSSGYTVSYWFNRTRTCYC